MKLSKYALALTLATGMLLANAATAQVSFEHDESAGTVEVHVRGEHFTTYHYGEDVRTPILWPVLAEGNVGVTRNYPMGEDDPDSADHPHHRSLWLNFGDVNGYDFWHGHPINTVDVELGESDGYGWIRVHNEWVDPEGNVLVREQQEMRFHDTPASGRLIDFISTLEAAQEEVTFGDDKEGFIAFRIRPEIEGQRAGVLTNARGEQGESNVYGTPAPWMDYSGPIEGYGQRGIAVFDHPANFRPGYWHVRDYGLAALNPFSRQGVGGEEEDGSYTLNEGETLTLQYRVYVHSGDVEEADVAGQYAQYIADTTTP